MSQTANSAKIIDHRYVLEERLGQGGMGEVFRARDLLMAEADDPDPYVALKLISAEIRDYPEAPIALQRECRRAQKLSHPNIVRVFHFGHDAPNYYLTMELLRGQAIERFMLEHSQGADLAAVAAWIEQLCNGLGYAHSAGIAHSDIKPSNLFITAEGVLKILDFGIAAPLPHANSAATRFNPRRLGALSPRYSSLEMHLGREADPRDDVFSAACVIYELLSGRHPFGGLEAPRAAALEVVPQPIPALSTGQNECLRKALALRREQRTHSMIDLLQGLFQTDPETRAWAGLRPMLLLGAAALVAISAALVAWWLSSPPAKIAQPSTGEVVSTRQPANERQIASSNIRKPRSTGKSAAPQEGETKPPEDPFVVK